MKYFIVVTLVVSLWSCATTKQNPATLSQAETAIKAVMSMQEQAWSDGDIDKFMTGYWKSEELSFIGRSGPNYGWQTTLNNYKKGYPTKDKMGKLTFDILKLNPLSADVYYMIGKYTLVRAEDTPTGYFSLVWKKIGGEWKIVSDHTSG